MTLGLSHQSPPGCQHWQAPALSLHRLARTAWPGLFSAVAVLVLLTGCSPASSSSAWNGLVKIGIVAPFEGQDGARASAFLQGMKLAQNEANRRGGIDGRRIDLVALDDQNDPAMAGVRARALVADPLIAAVVGHFTSEGASAAIEEYRHAGMPLLSPATAEGLAGPGFFRLGASDDQLADWAVEYARDKLGAAGHTVAAIEAGPSSDGQGNSLRKAAERRNMPIKTLTFAARTQDFTLLMRRVQETGARAVLFWGDAEQASILMNSLDDPRPAVIFVGDGYRLSRLIRPNPGPLFYVTPFDQDGDSSPLADFMAKYDGPNDTAPLAAAGYRAVSIVLDAVSATGMDGQVDRAKVRRALEDRANGGGLVSTAASKPHVFRLDGAPYPGKPLE